MKILFTCNTAVDHFNSVEQTERSYDSASRLYFESVYQYRFQKELETEKTIEISVFKPQAYDLSTPAGLEEAKAAFMEAARKADMIFHHYKLFQNEKDFCSHKEAFAELAVFADQAINDNPQLRSKSEVVVRDEGQLSALIPDDKVYCAEVCKANDIPTPRHYTMNEMKQLFESNAEIRYPLVFKDTHANNGRGVFFIERREQLATIFDEEKIALAKAKYPDIDFDRLSFAFEDFIQTPSDYHCKYRIVFNGFGSVHVNSIIKYSDHKKSDDRIEFFNVTEDARIYHDPRSPLYLASVQKQTHSAHANCLIALFPHVNPKQPTVEEKKILRAHGINPNIPAVPPKLLALAEKTAKVFAKCGFIGLQGHDWLQDENGNFYLIENNLTPASPGFRATRNAGRGGIFDAGLPIKAQATAQAIISTIKNIKLEYRTTLTATEFFTLMQKVIEIQKTIDWDEVDLKFAAKRLSNPECPKIIATNATNEVIGYATIVPQPYNEWYLSQIAVDGRLHKRGIGKAIMTELFYVARRNNIAFIILDTRESLCPFYSSFSVSTDIVCTGLDRRGHRRMQVIYSLNHQ